MSKVLFVTSMGKKIQCADIIWEGGDNECVLRYIEDDEQKETRVKDYVFKQIGSMNIIFSK